ncbi:MAG: hypothetical protein NTX53_08350 [candidate division WOR-3 bacterium]|nr:hypothetical protein [candidate division WOR-3 bacterium]
MNNSLPQQDEKRPDRAVATTGQAASPPKLVFEPDERQAARVARVRTFTVLAAAVLTLGALVLILTYRPRPPALPVQIAQARTVPLPESTTPVPAPAVIQQPPAFHETGVVGTAQLAAAAIDTLVSSAAGKWMRATELSRLGSVTRENGEDAVTKLRKAVVLADSARGDIALARQQAEVIFRASRGAESGTAFRLSALYAAIDRYLKSMADDADDRYSFYSKSEVSVKTVLLGDSAESDIQQNVAMSYLRRSEDRQNSIRRLAQQVREALLNIDNAGR